MPDLLSKSCINYECLLMMWRKYSIPLPVLFKLPSCFFTHGQNLGNNMQVL